MVDNIFLVPIRQWRKWTGLGQNIFNEMYSQMKDNQGLFKHPQGAFQVQMCWNTTAWNAAFTAAHEVTKLQKELAEAKNVKDTKVDREED